MRAGTSPDIPGADDHASPGIGVQVGGQSKQAALIRQAGIRAEDNPHCATKRVLANGQA